MTNLEHHRAGFRAIEDALVSHINCEAIDDLNFAKGAKDGDLCLQNAPRFDERLVSAMDALRDVLEEAGRALDARG